MKKLNFFGILTLLFIQTAFAQENKIATANEDFAQAALHPDSEPLIFTQSADYPWIAKEGYVTSGNKGIDGTFSWFSTTIENEYEIVLSFEWNSSSEGSCDYFNFRVNDTYCVRHSGNEESGFTNYSIVLPAGSYTLTWEYTKDGSISWNMDEAHVRNIKAYYYPESHPELLFDIINGVLIEYLGFGGKVEIPDGVVAIAKNVFSNNYNITSVTIPGSVTTIGNYAFSNCYNLQEITVQWAVPLTISPTVFEGVDKYRCGLNVPENSEEAYETAAVWKDFFNDSDFIIDENGVLTAYYGYGGNVIIPRRVTAISEEAFRYRSGIASISIPSKVTSIANQAFTYCYDLRALEVNAGNPVYSSLNGVLYNKDRTTLICHPASKQESSFTIPETVENIDYYAFANCFNLSSVTIPNHVTTIESMAFAYCFNLREITVQWETPISLNDDDVFYDINRNRCILWVPQNTKATYQNEPVWKQFKYILELGEDFDPIMLDFEIDKDGVLIGYYGNGGNVVIPEGVTAIGAEVFYNRYITSISIPNSVTSIGNYAFYYCTNLNSVKLPENLEHIGFAAFADCSNLLSISIPNSVTNIGDYAFAYCYSLREITVQWTTPLAILSTVFEGVDKRSCTLDVPEGSLEAYQNAAVWKNFLDKSDFEIDERGVLIKYYGMGGDVVIPEGVTAIGAGVFSGNYALISVHIPNSVTSIGYAAFDNCLNLLSVTLSENLIYIENYAFRYCLNLHSIILPENVTSIGDYTFADCTNLNSVILPENLTYIGYGAFNNCSNLNSITLPKNLTSIENYAFANCSSLNSIILPENLQYIGYYAFTDCSNLSSISIPNSVTSIDYGAFNSCYNLQEVTVHWTTPLELWNDIFWGVDKNFCTLKVPAGTKSAYQSAYVWQDFLNIEEDGVAIPTVELSKITVSLKNNDLSVNSPVSEKISVYSVTGKLLFHKEKTIGECVFNIEPIHDRIVIVKGSSGWAKKVMK